MYEEWRPVEGFEGMYEVSNLGRVRGLDRLIPMQTAACGYKKWKGKIISPDVLKDGYYKIGLHKGGKKHMLALHRVVAIAFVEGRTAEKRIINHKDCNPANNRADNLEWCTYAYNSVYEGCKQRAWATRMKRGKGYVNPPRGVDFWKDGKIIERFPSLVEAAKRIGCTATMVYYACKGDGRIGKIPGVAVRYSEQPEAVKG